MQECFNCGSCDWVAYDRENGYDLAKCGGCGMLMIQDPPTDKQRAEALRQGLHHGESTLDVTGQYSTWKVKNYESILADLYLEKPKNSIDWLDIGCGYGEFLEALRNFLPEPNLLVGSEPNETKQESARGRQLDVSFIDLRSEIRKFDAVSFLNVWSHLPDPPEFLGLVWELLKPDGELVMQTGDVSDLSPKDAITPYSLPDHLHFGSEQIVTQMLKRHGFEVITVQKYPIAPTDLVTIGKEIVKKALPGYRSQLKRVREVLRVGATDMYIRAQRRQSGE